MSENSRGNPPTSWSKRPSRIPRRRPIPSSSTPLDIANASPLARPSPLDPFQLPSNSYFQHANNVEIRGGHFTTESGQRLVNNWTINVTHLEPENGGHRAVPIAQSTLHQNERTVDEAETTDSNSMPGEGGDSATLRSNLSSESLPTTKTWNEIYETYLVPNGRSYPLWIPEPSKNLPLPYQRKGVQIGDVGIFDPPGAFSFIFNICVSRDDPINPRSLPEDFAPIHPPIDEIDLCKFADLKAGSYLASPSIEISQDDTTFPGLSFRTSGSEGAILTMPEGAISEDLQSKPKFRKYASANIDRWYRYINEDLEREVKNGDIHLVVGCDKTTSWGMASLSNVTQRSWVKFKPRDVQSSGSRYTWEYSGVTNANLKAGPDQNEIDELREGLDASAAQDKYLNQCLFVRTMCIRFNDVEWEKLNGGISSGCTTDAEHGTGTPSFSSSSRSGPSNGTQPTSFTTSGNTGTQQMASGSSTANNISPANRLNISEFAPPTSYHPSHILNEILLNKIPTAKMVITDSEDWYSCIQEDMTMCSDPEQILESILSVNDIREENGVVYLEPKVTREMEYFADLEKLSIELKQDSSNLEEYLYGVDPRRCTRWKEIVFLLEFCHDALLASTTKNLIGSLLIDELFLDTPDTFGSIYALRPSSQGVKPSSSSFRLDTFQELSLLLGRESTEMDDLNSSTESWENEDIFDKNTSPIQRSRKCLAISSCFYLMYMALGEFVDLERTIQYFRQQKLPDQDSLHAPPSEGVTTQSSPPRPIYQPQDRHVTSLARPSTDDDRSPVGYNIPGPALNDQMQPEYFPAPSQYPPQSDPYLVEIAAHKDNVSTVSLQNPHISSPSAHPPSPIPSDTFLPMPSRIPVRHIERTSQKPRVEGQRVASSVSQTRSGLKGKERDRPLEQDSSSHQIPQTFKTDMASWVAGYRFWSWGVDVADSSSEIMSMTTGSARSIGSGGSSEYGSSASSSTNLTSDFGSDKIDWAKTRDATIASESANLLFSQDLSSGSPPATKTWNKVYETQLAPIRRGYPLWTPQPNKHLPLPYRRKGIQIGDVGVFDPSGAFSFIFNIRVSRDDPINPKSLPEDFVPIHPPIDEIDIIRYTAFKAGSYLASPSIEIYQDDTPSLGLCFRSSGSEGAILTMPEGAISEDLANLSRFLQYVSVNIERWYRYINGTLGRGVRNGDVHLVVGCDRATSWGMAALSDMTPNSQLKFKPLEAQSLSSRNCGYTWEYSGMGDMKVGPAQEEIEELREPGSVTPDKYLNQCLFVRALSFTLNDAKWKNLHSEIGMYN